MSVPHHSLDMMRCDLEIHCWRRVAKWSWLVLPLLLLLVVAGCQRRSSNAAEPTIQVYAASSLTDVLNRIRDDFQKQSPYRVELTLDSSATLAKQIEQGAPADLFISANRQWADYVVEKLGDRASAPKDLLSNRLVLIAERDAQLEVNQLSDLVHVPDLRLALGNPESVPAGIYAKQVLEAEQLWSHYRTKFFRRTMFARHFSMLKRAARSPPLSMPLMCRPRQACACCLRSMRACTNPSSIRWFHFADLERPRMGTLGSNFFSRNGRPSISPNWALFGSRKRSVVGGGCLWNGGTQKCGRPFVGACSWAS